MSEYNWSRPYIFWGLPFSTGIKYINSISDRHSGKNSIAERLKDKMMTELAEMMTEFNKCQEQH